MFFWPIFDELPAHLTIKGSDWCALFNEAVPRELDVELLHELRPSIFYAFCLEFSPDGRLLAAACERCVRIFDTSSGRLVCDLKHDPGHASEECDGWGHIDPIRCVCFFPEGTTLVAGGLDGLIRQWDVERRVVSATFAGHEAMVRVLGLSRDATVMVSGSEDNTLRIWDVPSGQQVKVTRLDTGIRSLALSPDGTCFAVAAGPGLWTYSCPDGHVMEQLDGPDGHGDDVFCLAFSPDGTHFASASLDKTTKVWKLGQAGGPSSLLHTLEGHEDLALCVCWTPDGHWLMTGSKDRSIHIWDAKTGSGQAAMAAHKNSIWAASSSPDGRLFATTGADCSIRVWSYSPHVAGEAEQSFWRGKTAGSESSGQGGTLGKPGSGLPLNFLPPLQRRFPVLMGDEERDWMAATLLIREACMLKMMEELTNKPQWWLKARDAEICDRWKREALDMDWAAYREHGDFTAAMADACIDELRVKAHLFERTGLVPVFDYSACVIKSDSVAVDLIKALKAAVSPLEDVPEERKDWHPGSAAKVLDLVHPSLWPLLYGRTRILTEDRIGVQDCLGSCGLGEVVAKPDASQLVMKRDWLGECPDMASLSFRFQWLPCDVSVDGRGRTRIDSYINNLHPMDHGGLYDVVNGFIERSLPAWDVIYQWPTTFCFQRLRAARVGPKCGTRELCEKVYECRPMNRPLNGGETERQDDEERQDGFEESERARLDSEWFEATHPVEVPDVVTASQASQRASQTPSRQPDEPHQFRLQPKDVKHSGFFNGASRIQVIVKLANIHLTPEQPTYDGGSWHIEGQLNEHICATALYYYDNDNITESRLAFRARSNVEELRSALEYEQWDYRSISRTFAIDAVPGRDTTLQDVGSILTREGRALFFPNLFQHRVEPFSLVDRSRPGHRKILALFLVDPAIPIISTANVPPQQPHWRPGGGEAEGDAISEAEARRIREELMAERSALQSKTTERLRAADFNFCEH